jgi:hypothetical protein
MSKESKATKLPYRFQYLEPGTMTSFCSITSPNSSILSRTLIAIVTKDSVAGIDVLSQDSTFINRQGLVEVAPKLPNCRTGGSTELIEVFGFAESLLADLPLKATHLENLFDPCASFQLPAS